LTVLANSIVRGLRSRGNGEEGRMPSSQIRLTNLVAAAGVAAEVPVTLADVGTPLVAKDFGATLGDFLLPAVCLTCSAHFLGTCTRHARPSAVFLFVAMLHACGAATVHGLAAGDRNLAADVVILTLIRKVRPHGIAGQLCRTADVVLTGTVSGTTVVTRIADPRRREADRDSVGDRGRCASRTGTTGRPTGTSATAATLSSAPPALLLRVGLIGQQTSNEEPKCSAAEPLQQKTPRSGLR